MYTDEGARKRVLRLPFRRVYMISLWYCKCTIEFILSCGETRPQCQLHFLEYGV